MVTISEGDTFTVAEMHEIFSQRMKDGDETQRVLVLVGSSHVRLNATSFGVYANDVKQEAMYFELLADADDAKTACRKHHEWRSPTAKV